MEVYSVCLAHDLVLLVSTSKQTEGQNRELFKNIWKQTGNIKTFETNREHEKTFSTEPRILQMSYIYMHSFNSILFIQYNFWDNYVSFYQPRSCMRWTTIEAQLPQKVWPKRQISPWLGVNAENTMAATNVHTLELKISCELKSESN